MPTLIPITYTYTFTFPFDLVTQISQCIKTTDINIPDSVAIQISFKLET